LPLLTLKSVHKYYILLQLLRGLPILSCSRGLPTTLLRRELCGWDPIDNLATSPSVSFLCSRQSSGSLSLPVTLALSSIGLLDYSPRQCQAVNAEAVNVGTCICALPICFLTPTTTPTSDQIADTSSCPDSGPGIYIVSP